MILREGYFLLVGLKLFVFLCLSGSSGGSGGRESSSNSMGIPLAVPTPSPPSIASGDCSHFSQWPLALGDDQHHIKMIKCMSITVIINMEKNTVMFLGISPSTSGHASFETSYFGHSSSSSIFFCTSLLCLSFSSVLSAVVHPGPGLGPIPMSQFGTISRQISRQISSTTSSSASMVSATGTYRRAPASSSQFSVSQPHLNGGPTYPQNISEFSSKSGRDI